MITAKYINELRKQVDRAHERFESNPTHQNEFILTLLVTSLEARLRTFNHTELGGLHSATDTLCGIESHGQYETEYMGES